MATTFEIDFGYARFSVQSEERLIQNARERARERRGRKEKKKKGEKTEERTKFLTPSKSICPRYQTANGYCENDDCKRKRGIKKKRKGKKKKEKI